MYSEKELKNLVELSKKGTEQIRIELAKQDLVMQGVIKNAPTEQVPKLEKLRMLTNKVIQLHKDGKTEEANKVTEEIKNLI